MKWIAVLLFTVSTVAGFCIEWYNWAWFCAGVVTATLLVPEGIGEYKGEGGEDWEG